MTQDELIGTSDHVPINIWTVIFPEEQGYEIKKNIIFEDNHITIRMAKNGGGSVKKDPGILIYAISL